MGPLQAWKRLMSPISRRCYGRQRSSKPVPRSLSGLWPTLQASASQKLAGVAQSYPTPTCPWQCLLPGHPTLFVTALPQATHTGWSRGASKSRRYLACKTGLWGRSWPQSEMCACRPPAPRRSHWFCLCFVWPKKLSSSARRGPCHFPPLRRQHALKMFALLQMILPFPRLVNLRSQILRAFCVLPSTACDCELVACLAFVCSPPTRYCRR